MPINSMVNTVWLYFKSIWLASVMFSVMGEMLRLSVDGATSSFDTKSLVNTTDGHLSSFVTFKGLKILMPSNPANTMDPLGSLSAACSENPRL